MNKQDNKLAFLVLATLTTGIGLIYTLIMYPDIFFAVIGMSVLFLISAFVLTKDIIIFATMKNKSLNVQIRDCVDGISNQLEAMNGVQAQIGKATFLYTKKAAQSVATLENNYTESQEALYKNLVSLSNAHNKATKLMIKYDQSNTTKVISTLKDLRTQLNDTMIQGFDQLQAPDNTEVVNTLGEIVEYLKSQSGTMDEALGLQLTNIAQELQNVSNSIQNIQFVQPEISQTIPQDIPTMSSVQTSEPDMGNEQINLEHHELEINIPEMEAAVNAVETDIDIPEMEPIAEEPEITVADTSDAEAMEAEPVQPEIIAEEPTEPEPVVPETKDINAKMSDDEIAALFASAEPVAKKESEPADNTTEDTEEAFTPTFTVVGKSDEEVAEEEVEEEPASNVTTIGDLGGDPNKQLSPDEIAALFASAEPAPKKEEKPVAAEPVATAPVSDDPNKQLSPDEIAALFASAEPAPKKEPVKVQPVSSDPNKQLSPDEIAALFAASSS